MTEAEVLALFAELERVRCAGGLTTMACDPWLLEDAAARAVWARIASPECVGALEGLLSRTDINPYARRVYGEALRQSRGL